MTKTFKKSIVSAMLAAATFTAGVSIAPTAIANTGYACTVNKNSNVRIRVNAGQNYRIIGAVPNGRYVRILNSKIGSDGGLWYLIQYGNIRGWSHSAYIC